MAETVEYKSENPQTAYEPADWRLGPIGWVFLGTFAFLVIAPFVLMAAFPDALQDASRRVLVAPPAPQLQIDAAGDLARFRASENRLLNDYYWVDRSKGIVHIPIDQAMRKLAKEGIPGFPKAPQ